MGKIVVDIGTVEKSKIKVSQFLYLLAKQNGLNSEDEKELHSKKLLNQGLDGTYYLSKDGNTFIDRVIVDGIKDLEFTKRDIADIIDEMRMLFPTGKKTGTNNYWRGNLAELRDRLTIFLKRHGNFPKEDILAATQKYIDSYQGDYRLMRTLKYFIFKKNPDGSFEYDLLTQLEHLHGSDVDSGVIETSWIV